MVSKKLKIVNLTFNIWTDREFSQKSPRPPFSSENNMLLQASRVKTDEAVSEQDDQHLGVNPGHH